jgi:hypothetical protein
MELLQWKQLTYINTKEILNNKWTLHLLDNLTNFMINLLETLISEFNYNILQEFLQMSQHIPNPTIKT